MVSRLLRSWPALVALAVAFGALAAAPSASGQPAGARLRLPVVIQNATLPSPTPTPPPPTATPTPTPTPTPVPDALVVLERVNGRIWDVRSDRLLFLDSSGATPVLGVHDRASGTTVAVPAPAGLVPATGYLTPRGALFVARGDDAAGVYEWRDGALTELRRGRWAHAHVDGGYAYWLVDGVPYRRDLTAGTDVALPLGTWPYATGGVALASGDVVYLVSGQMDERGLLHYRDGTVTALAAGASRMWPVGADAVNVGVLHDEGQWVVEVLGFDGALRLRETISREEPGTMLARGGLVSLAGGYVAFAREGADRHTRVLLRLPTGEEWQVSFLTGSSYVEAVSPNGQVVFTNGGRRYLAGPGLATRDVGAATAGTRSLWQDGRWLVVDGGVLYAVA